MADSTASSVPLVFSSQFLDDGEQDSSLGLIILNRPLPWVTSTLWRRGAPLQSSPPALPCRHCHSPASS